MSPTRPSAPRSTILAVAAVLVLLTALPAMASALAGGAVRATELPLASETVPRIAEPARAQPPSAGPIATPAAAQPAVASSAPAASEPAPADEGALAAAPDLGQDAYGRLVEATLGGLDRAGLELALRQYGADLGWAAPPSRPNQFSENSTISYTHDIGDVDRDGVRDIALDVYCTSTQGCPDFNNRIQQGGSSFSIGPFCSKPHILVTASGRDGHEIRNRSLDAPHALPPLLGGGCTIDFVIGTVPLGDGTRGVLLYSIGLFEVLSPQRLQIMHDVRLLDMKTGEPVWTFHAEGSYYSAPTLNLVCRGIVADTLLLNPLPQQPPARGIGPVGRDALDTLDIQGVGFRIKGCDSWQADGTVLRQPVVFLNDYDPDEWMARLDPRSGETLWRVATFGPDEAEHSVIPRFLFRDPLAGTYPPADLNWEPMQVVRLHDHYWNKRPCCYDLTGDGINDLAATTLEYTDTPYANTDSLEGLRSRLVVFDGASGERLSETVLVEDTSAGTLATRLEPLGDGDGDGKGEILVHVVTLHPTYRHILSVRNADGGERWRIDNPRDLDILVVGDADEDGGNDFLLVEWENWEGAGTYGRPIATPYTNVTHLPLTVFSGRDGSVAWRHDSFGAVIDIVTAMGNLRINGVPDLDGNGVAEVLTDDPTVLPDRTVIHRLAFIDPRSDEVAARIITAGAFAMPAMAGDSNGDGRDDLVLLNGDINDLWLTMHSPDGEAQWSRRIATPRLSGYQTAVPTLRTHEIDAIGRPGTDLLLNFQLSYMTVGSFVTTSSLAQQITGMHGGNGTLVWAAPGNYDGNLTLGTPGASPASTLFADALERDAHPLAQKTQRVVPLALPGLLVAIATGIGGFLITRRLRL